MNSKQYTELFQHAPDSWHLPLNKAMLEYGITNNKREAAFLAMVAHHTDNLTSLENGAFPYREDDLPLISAAVSEHITHTNSSNPDVAFRVAAYLFKQADGNRLSDAGLTGAITVSIFGYEEVEAVRTLRNRIMTTLVQQ
jgi:predicted chitinase